METNTVTYDGTRITVREMEEALRRTGTYRKTFGDPGKRIPDKEKTRC